MSPFLFWVHVFEYLIIFLYDFGQEYLVLLGYTDRQPVINLGVEPFIPLLLAQSVTNKYIYGTLLFVNCIKLILVFGLSYDDLLS